jgi:hypothetical protein
MLSLGNDDMRLNLALDGAMAKPLFNFRFCGMGCSD